jgi:hypothetical protein
MMTRLKTWKCQLMSKLTEARGRPAEANLKGNARGSRNSSCNAAVTSRIAPINRMCELEGFSNCSSAQDGVGAP